MDRHLTLEFVRVTEYAALAVSYFIGRGDEKKADKVAVESMKKAFNTVKITGKVVIGEGERDEAPMLCIGENLGQGGVEVDIAVDPLEGTKLCANHDEGSLSVLAVSEKGGLLHAPDTYMRKLAVGPKARGKVHLNQSVSDIFKTLSLSLLKPIESLTVAILDRPRHKDLIAKCRSVGVKVKLISDGDVSAALATCWPDSGIDVLLGTGGAPEGVITAAALKCLDGDFQGQLDFNEDKNGSVQKKRALEMGIKDLNQIYTIDELVSKPVIFCATGVTDGPFLKGVCELSDQKITTQSMVMRSDTGTVRTVWAQHNLHKKQLK